MPGESDSKLSRWQCSSCGNAFYLRRCSACAGVCYVDGLQGFRMPWPCTWCGQFNRGFRPNRDPAAATAAELAADVARYGPPRSGARPASGGQASPAPVADGSPGTGSQDPGDRGLTPATSTGRPGVPPPAGQAAPSRAGRRPVRYIALLIAVAAACVAAASVLVAETGSVAAGMPPGPGGMTRAVRVTASGVNRIEFQGVPGQLAIVGADSGPVTLTGQLHGASGAPAVETRHDGPAGVLVVTIRCAPARPCTQNLRLAVPAGTATTVRQPSGRIVVTALAGPLSITAAHVDISASGLRSPDLAAVITSGHLSATFATPPSQVSITLAAAQATLRLPASAAYHITREVTAGYVKVAIPQAGTATHSVTVRIDSGELELLPA